LKTFNSDLILTENTVFNDSITVRGDIICKDGLWNINADNINAFNINAQDITAFNINADNITAQDINAWDIICEKRIKLIETSKTICRILIQEKSKLKLKEHLI